jgi:hypothetical protein
VKNLKVIIYKTVNLPVVLYGCETLSLPLKEEYRLRAFENRMLRRIFEPRRKVVGWRKSRSEKLRNLYSSQTIMMIVSGRMKWAGGVARMQEKRNACIILVRNPAEKRPLGRRRHRCVDNIKIYMKETGCEGVKLFWIRTSGGLLNA